MVKLAVDLSAPMSSWATDIAQSKRYMHVKPSGRYEDWEEVATRVAESVVRPYLPAWVEPVRQAIERREFMPGGRYLYACGRQYQQVNSCFLFRAEDSREGWGDLGYKSRLCLMTGGGIGCDYSALREYGRLVTKMGGEASGPCALMIMTNEEGRYIRQGGSRRSAIWAGLRWNHPDIKRFCKLKDWPVEIRALKEKDFSFPAPMDGTNISVILDDEFFEAYEDGTNSQHALATDVYWTVVKRMLKTGEPGFSVNVGDKRRESLRNACTEVTSEDDGDMCNLGSINMARVVSIERFVELVELGMVFLLCGTLMSQLPIQSMYKIREKNRRLGLGLMGIHEWLLRRGKRYGPDSELGEWMSAYRMSGAFANRWCDKLSITRSVATRAIAPNGTIGIVGETTSSAEPMIAAAYQRRYLDGETWCYQNVLDPVAKRLVEDDGIDPDVIEDAYTIAEDYERRIAFQGWLQQFVDMSISSTINLPQWGSSINNEGTVTRFGETLYRYLPHVRGITAYPDGARGGQPLVRLKYTEAIRRGVGIVFREQGTVGGNGFTPAELKGIERNIRIATSNEEHDKETLVDTFLDDLGGRTATQEGMGANGQESEAEQACRLANGGCTTGTCGE